MCGTFLLLSLPPESGRLEVRQANLLLIFLVVQLVVVTYLCSASASMEVLFEGEKGLPDLVLSGFSPRTIAVGKAASSAAYAAWLVAMALPLVALASAVRGAGIGMVLGASAVIAAVGTAAGTWGAWLAGRLASDFTRSFVHWVLLAALLGGTALLGPRWEAVSPLRVLDGVVRSGWTPTAAASAVGYLVVGAVGAWLIERHVRRARVEEGDS